MAPPSHANAAKQAGWRRKPIARGIVRRSRARHAAQQEPQESLEKARQYSAVREAKTMLDLNYSLRAETCFELLQM
jgi:hypothetical protein